MAIEPITASVFFTNRLGLNDLCVNSRWKPTVTPCRVTTYITTVTSTSLQPSQPPHATGTAARTARNGSRMNAPSAICSLRDWVSPPRVASRATGASSRMGADVVIWVPHVVRGVPT
jgi:hypothetical protein